MNKSIGEVFIVGPDGVHIYNPPNPTINYEKIFSDMEEAQRVAFSQWGTSTSMMHPHDKCTPCNEAHEATHVAFVEDCTKLFRGSFSELFEKLQKKGYKILKPETQKPQS